MVRMKVFPIIRSKFPSTHNISVHYSLELESCRDSFIVDNKFADEIINNNATPESIKSVLEWKKYSTHNQLEAGVTLAAAHLPAIQFPFHPSLHLL